jgi:hypothetical protein
MQAEQAGSVTEKIKIRRLAVFVNIGVRYEAIPG